MTFSPILYGVDARFRLSLICITNGVTETIEVGEGDPSELPRDLPHGTAPSDVDIQNVIFVKRLKR